MYLYLSDNLSGDYKAYPDNQCLTTLFKAKYGILSNQARHSL